MQRTPLRRTLAATAALALATGLGAGLAPPASAHGQHSSSGAPVVVTTGLDNPRQLAVGPHGSLFIAEAGAGGTNCQGEGEDESCFGATSRISKLAHPGWGSSTAKPVVDGLPSNAGGDGSFAVGTAGVGVGGHVYGVNDLADPSNPPDDPGGKLFKVVHGQVKIVADIAGYENSNDPDHQGADSNAYAVLAQRGRILVADAAANTVLAVGKHGKISTFHVFGNIQTGPCAEQPNDEGTTGCDFVPTSLAQGPKGTVFVTGLASEVPGEGRVVQLSKNGKLLKEWKGFTTPTGIVVRSDCSFYVSELFANADFENPNPPEIGQVTKVSKNGVRSSRTVPLPAGLAIIGKKLYVAAYSVAPASGLFGNPDWNGQIWRMSL